MFGFLQVRHCVVKGQVHDGKCSVLLLSHTALRVLCSKAHVCCVFLGGHVETDETVNKFLFLH